MSAKDKLDLNQRSHGKKTASQEKAPTGCQELLPTDKGVNNETRLWCITTMPWVFMGVVHVLYDAMNTVVGVGAKYEVAWGIGFFSLYREAMQRKTNSLCAEEVHICLCTEGLWREREKHSLCLWVNICVTRGCWEFIKKKNPDNLKACYPRILKCKQCRLNN